MSMMCRGLSQITRTEPGRSGNWRYERKDVIELRVNIVKLTVPEIIPALAEPLKQSLLKCRMV